MDVKEGAEWVSRKIERSIEAVPFSKNPPIEFNIDNYKIYTGEPTRILDDDDIMVRVLSGAFIINGKDFLMMKRSENKKIAPGVWGGVGGHAEPKELNDPKITLIYMYIGTAKERFYKDRTEEGKLYWINENELLDRQMSFEIRKVLEHYIEFGHKSNEIKVGVVSKVDKKPQMNWNSLDSWEGLTGMC